MCTLVDVINIYHCAVVPSQLSYIEYIKFADIYNKFKMLCLLVFYKFYFGFLLNKISNCYVGRTPGTSPMIRDWIVSKESSLSDHH